MACQEEKEDADVEEGEEEEADDGGEAEFDSMLMECAGDLLPVIAKVMGAESFMAFFTSFVNDSLKQLVSGRGFL